MTKKSTLSKRLEALRDRTHTFTVSLSSAAKVQDKEGWRGAQAGLLQCWKEWDKAIKQVAELEQLTYNVNEVLAVCQEDEEM